MGSFQIRWRKSAQSDLKAIDRSSIPVIIGRIESLAEDPFPRQSKKLRARGNARRLRVGDYRVLYEVDVESKTIWIAAVGPRGSVYR